MGDSWVSFLGCVVGSLIGVCLGQLLVEGLGYACRAVERWGLQRELLLQVEELQCRLLEFTGGNDEVQEKLEEVQEQLKEVYEAVRVRRAPVTRPPVNE